MNRREFLGNSTAAAVGVATFGWPQSLAAQMAPTPIGIQVGAVSFVDEGTDKVLDTLAEIGGIDTLFLATFTYGRGIGGRQPRGSPLPDHGRQVTYDQDYHGGIFATPHRRRVLPLAEHGQRQWGTFTGEGLAAPTVTCRGRPQRRLRGNPIAITLVGTTDGICWFEDVFRKDVAGLDKAFEMRHHGQPRDGQDIQLLKYNTRRLLSQTPNTLNFWLGLTERRCRVPATRAAPAGSRPPITLRRRWSVFGSRAARPAEQRPWRQPRRRADAVHRRRFLPVA